MVQANKKGGNGIAALLSFFIPGLGQLIKGQFLKAIGIWIVIIILGALIFVSAVASIFLIGLPFLALFGIAYIILYIWNIYDAYHN
jgi:TM2 domain-containing membrane protein YozV